jgi:hypothetical protein
MVVLAFLAIQAGKAGARRRDGDALAGAKSGNALAHRRDNARDFMAQGHGLFDAHGAKTAMLKVMEVRAANAAKSNTDLQLTRARGLGGLGVDPQIFGGVANESAHK